MTQIEKIEILKETITQLYEKEGRSKLYISDLLKINRKSLTQKINEWELVKADKRHLNPSNKKFLNKNRKIIIDMLDSDYTITDIALRIQKTRDSLLKTFIKNDKELLHHYNEYNKRLKIRSNERKELLKENSSREYFTESLEGELWQEIMGYSDYFISNKGRIKKYAKSYKSFYLKKIAYNQISGYGYVCLVNKDGKRKNLSVARLVAHSFVEGYSEEKNTVDHKDGNKRNNEAINLEWVSQSENNENAYKNGKLPHKSYSRNGRFKKLIIDGKYEFKTIRAAARFLNLSETQTQRYISGETKTEHTFQFIY